MPPLGKSRLPVYSNGTLEESITNRTRGLHVSTVREERRPLVYMPVKKVSRPLLVLSLETRHAAGLCLLERSTVNASMAGKLPPRVLSKNLEA